MKSPTKLETMYTKQMALHVARQEKHFENIEISKVYASQLQNGTVGKWCQRIKGGLDLFSVATLLLHTHGITSSSLYAHSLCNSHFWTLFNFVRKKSGNAV